MSFPNHAPIKLMAGFNTASSGLSGTTQSSLNDFYLPSDLPYSVHNFDEGDIVFKEGEDPQGVYLLKSGCVKMYVNRENSRGRTTTPEYVTKLVSPGEVFGYKAIVSDSKTNCYAKAVKDSTVWLYSKESIFQVMMNSHPVLKTILEQSVMDIQNYEKNNQLHYLASVQERIAYQLIILADRFGVQTPQGVSINLKLTRNEFAQLASTINESLSRHLTEFKNEGLVDVNGKEIIIKDRAGLAAKSGNF